VVLLIDEVDKSDPEFEAFLLELLSDFQVTIPEIGTQKARNIPFVVLTSNNYRDMSDALKRRCIHIYIDYPDRELEMRVVTIKIPGIAERLAGQVVDAVRNIRNVDLKKKPCISETIDWARSLIALNVEDLTPDVLLETLNMLCKYRSDAQAVRLKAEEILTGHS
jgi:MoxR-like ATPase